MSQAAAKRTMTYVRLGSSGLKVSRVILGCMSYGDSRWLKWVLDEEESITQIKAAYDMGIQTFDTSNVYSNGLGEVVLGKAIRQHQLPRDEIVVMTKVFGAVSRDVSEHLYGDTIDGKGYVNQYGLSRKHIFDSVKHSLERLGLDYIDVLQCHRFDKETPIEETMQALHDVVKAGYVRYIGASSCYAWEYYALAHNLTPFISMQNHYNLLYREEEREMMPTLKHLGVGAIPWSPLARGHLTRPFGESTLRAGSDPWGMAYAGGASKEIIDRVEHLAQKKHISMAQLALAWLLHQDGVCAPVVGTTSAAKLRDTLRGLDVALTADEVGYLAQAYVPRGVFGH
ncbi:Aldo/keto reductase [Dentipellis sp. KUC8613]|nr:Aldo/keto reductase [Dentipellis sp. KUC8613]